MPDDKKRISAARARRMERIARLKRLEKIRAVGAMSPKKKIDPQRVEKIKRAVAAHEESMSADRIKKREKARAARTKRIAKSRAGRATRRK